MPATGPLTPGTIQAFDGRFLVRGGDHEVIAGAWTPGRLVLLEFESPARAAAWYDSPAYVEARAIRQSASTGNMVHLEGDGGAPAEAAASISSSAIGPAEPTPTSPAPPHTGRILAGGSAPTVKEGRWPDGQLSVIEFDDRAAATALVRV